MLLCTLASGLSGQEGLEPPEIVEIVFQGNTFISSAELQGEISLQPKTLFSNGSLYNLHHVNREGQKLKNFYQQYGFLDATVRDSLVELSPDAIEVVFIVFEGPRYYLRDITIQGNEVYSDEKYLANINFQRGAPFNVFEIRSQLQLVLREYEENGYPLVMIRDSVAVSDSVELFIQVSEGLKLSIGNIVIPELEDIPARIIERELIVKSGDLFNISRIEESKRRLFETSLFSNVNISTTSLDSSARTLDLLVEALPAKFRAFDIDFGAEQKAEYINADPVVSMGLTGSWYHNNLFDSSRRLKVQTQVNSIYPNIFIPTIFHLDLFYVEPWILGVRIPFTVNPFYRYFNDRERPVARQSLAGGLRIGTSYRWFRRVKIVSFLEWSTVSSQGEQTEDEIVYEEQRSFDINMLFDGRNDYFKPSRGYKVTLEPKLVGYFFGGQQHYWQMESAVSTYWNLFDLAVFAQNLNIAVSGVQDSTTAIPPLQRYYLGGNSSVRGFDHQGLDPAGSGLTPQGGHLRLFANLELRFPIYKIIGGELFYDTGFLWSEIEDFNLEDLESAFGFGLTIDTPIGPARVDYGIPFLKEGGTGKGQMHIAISHAF